MVRTVFSSAGSDEYLYVSPLPLSASSNVWDSPSVFIDTAYALKLISLAGIMTVPSSLVSPPIVMDISALWASSRSLSVAIHTMVTVCGLSEAGPRTDCASVAPYLSSKYLDAPEDREIVQLLFGVNTMSYSDSILSSSETEASASGYRSTSSVRLSGKLGAASGSFSSFSQAANNAAESTIPGRSRVNIFFIALTF